jgi:hypothetical protein
MINSPIDHHIRPDLGAEIRAPLFLCSLVYMQIERFSFVLFIFVHTHNNRARGSAKSENRTPLVDPEAIEFSQRFIHPFIRKIPALHVLLVVMHHLSVAF